MFLKALKNALKTHTQNATHKTYEALRKKIVSAFPTEKNT